MKIFCRNSILYVPFKILVTFQDFVKTKIKKIKNVFIWDPRKEIIMNGSQLSFYNKKGKLL